MAALECTESSLDTERMANAGGVKVEYYSCRSISSAAAASAKTRGSALGGGGKCHWMESKQMLACTNL